MNRFRSPLFPVPVRTGSLVLLLALTGSCGELPAGASVSEPATELDPDTESTSAGLRSPRPPAFVDVTETFTDENDQNRWFELTYGLRSDFDDICGDTFCEGEFSNLESMSFRCSASARSGQLKTCLWLFAGSNEEVIPSSGRIRTTTKFFSCTVPVTGTARALLDALLVPGGDGPLYRPLPGSTISIYQHLGDCL